MMMNNQASLKSPSGVKKKIEDNSPARKLIDHEMMKSHGKSLKQEGKCIFLAHLDINQSIVTKKQLDYRLFQKNEKKES